MEPSQLVNGANSKPTTSNLQQYLQHLSTPAKVPMIGGLQPAPPQYGENITSEGYKVVIALCSFQPSRLNQLAFDKYDKLIVIDDTSDADWCQAYLASDPLKQSGAVPSSLLTPYTFQSEPWFFGDVSRRTVEQLLSALSINGAFLIRNCAAGDGTLILSLFNFVSPRLKPVIHYRVQRAFGRYYLTPSQSFPMLADLIGHYSAVDSGLPHRLTRACPREPAYTSPHPQSTVNQKVQCRCCGATRTTATAAASAATYTR